MKIIIFISCIILIFISNYICYYKGLIRGMEYSFDKTYDVFILAMYTKLKKDNKSEEEAKSFIRDVHDLLINTTDKV